jgi:hypothetical protein
MPGRRDTSFRLLHLGVKEFSESEFSFQKFFPPHIVNGPMHLFFDKDKSL